MADSYKTLEYTEILAALEELALSDKAKKMARELRASVNEKEILDKQRETTEAKKIIEIAGTPPLTIMKGVEETVTIAVKGGMLTIEELQAIAGFVNSCDKMKKYLKRAALSDIGFAMIFESLCSIESLVEEVENNIQGVMIHDNASKLLRDTRKKISLAGEKIKTRLNNIIRGNKSYFADSFISVRNNRQTIPVKKEYKNKVPGVVVDTSQTGSTLFIEPNEIKKLQDELYLLQIEEDNEIRRVLYTLSAMVAEYEQDINRNIEVMEALDFVFAKAKLSLEMNANQPMITTNDDCIIIKNGRHPLITDRDVVPLNFEIGGGVKGVIITGPNTGGKTVTLKTVGLFALMAQSGLHVPAGLGTSFCVRDVVLCDIGDGQSITENLSTFSSHMSNIIDIMENTTQDSLILLDELGSGTDPAEGMGLAIAILEQFSKTHCLIVATTHYPEVKEFAKAIKVYVNARMAFDKESLKPLYKLEIGEAGESCALYIAKSLGFPENLLKRAHDIVYNSNKKSYEMEYTYEGEEEVTVKSESKTSVIKKYSPKIVSDQGSKFGIGDSVIIYPKKQLGIICSLEDSNGFFGVQIKGEKISVNHKRLKLNIEAKELYPEGYDFSIVFDSVDTRKARNQMGKKHVPGLEIKE